MCILIIFMPRAFVRLSSLLKPFFLHPFLMIQLSTRTAFVLAFLLHSLWAFGQIPNCPDATFFKTFGAESISEYGTVLLKSNDGNLYLGGRNGQKSFLQKLSPAGDVIWMREFQINPFEAVTLVQIIEDSDGMIVGCGTHNQFAGTSRGIVFRYNPVANTMLWSRAITSTNPSSAGILEKTPGSSFIYYQNTRLNSGATDIEILDLERATGNIIPAFASRYEHISYDVITKMVSVEGSLYGLGAVESVDSFSATKRRLMLTRFDPVNGMPIWTKISHEDPNPNTDYMSRDLLADGDELLAAYLVDEDIFDDPDTGPNVVHLQKTDLDGNILWAKRYERFTSILRVISVSDGYVLSGQRTGGSRYFVFKVTKNGDFVWGRELDYGPPGGVNLSGLGPDQSAAIGDSLFFAGIANSGVSDVLLWKMYADGTMADSCGFVSEFVLQPTDILNPVATSINLQQLLSSAASANVSLPMIAGNLEETMVCPDCSIPDPCPEDNDFNVRFGDLTCAGGRIQLSLDYCELNGDGLSDGLQLSVYNTNPFTSPADRLLTITYNAPGSPDSCATELFADLEDILGAANVQNGAQLFVVVNDPGNTNTPFSFSDFPLSEFEECDYTNNLDSFTIQLPSAPTLSLGADRSVCANETTVLDGGPGYFRYQWSNGVTTQTNSINFPGQYRLTVTDFCGFRQIDTINVEVLPLPLLQESAEFCPGKSVTVRGFTFNQAGTFQRTIPGVGADCDTAATFFISILPYEERIETFTICPFQTVTINGVVYDDPGLVRDTVASSVGCDTIVFYFINQLPLPFRFFDLEACQGDSVVFNGNAYFQSTSFSDTLYNNGLGCDTIAYVDITFIVPTELRDTIQFCPGASVEIGGQTYTQPGEAILILPSSTGLCDTLVIYTLEWLPAPMKAETLQFCPGDSVDIGGQFYTQPGTVLFTIPGAGGCDTLVTYTLEWLPSPLRAETVAFCAGTSVEIDGQTYTQPGIVTQTIPDLGGGCDTIVTYTLEFAPLPTRSETLEFCAGESINVGGQNYTQPTTVTITAPGAGNDCDTLVTYTLQFLTPPPSTLSLNCPTNVVVTTSPGTGSVPVSYTLPNAISDCVCPGIDITRTAGPASGSLFPVGNTQVCYAAQDSCGSIDDCCFLVTVREELPCDTKTNGCVKYDLLGITANSSQQRTYRIRVTNNCTNKLIYTAIQLPNGVSAVSPANLSTYTSPDGRNYDVRNPNYSPFYSIRFKSKNDSISNGQSEVFEYTLPAQSQPTHIHITTRVATQTFYPAHLNTFNCPIGVSLSELNQEREEETVSLFLPQDDLLVFPNPTTGILYADLSRWNDADLQLQILDSRGVRVQSFAMNGSSNAQALPLANHLPAGLYFLEIRTAEGERAVARFVLQR